MCRASTTAELFKIKHNLGAVHLCALIALAISLGISGPVYAEESDARLLWSQRTENGRYEISIRPTGAEIPIAERHTWTVSIRDDSGTAIIPRQLAFFGGMRGHGHGLPSSPRVTRQIEPGTYLVDGIVFNMHGEWEIVVGVVGNHGPDKATFLLDIQPQLHDDAASADWSAAQMAMLQSLSFDARKVRSPDPSNHYDGEPEAIALGQALFFDVGLSLNGDISCASCHDPRLQFTDGKKRSIGSKQLKRNSPTLLGVARADWFYWDGRRDSLWAQALTPIETPGEMDNNRLAVVRYVMQADAYASKLSRLVGSLPNVAELPAAAGPFGPPEVRTAWHALDDAERQAISHAFAAIGKIIASYVASLEPAHSRFDAYVASLTEDSDETRHKRATLTASEVRGLRLYLDPEKTQCLRCHNGPYFTNFGFNNIGTAQGRGEQPPDFGRMIGLRAALIDEFNCVGSFSDADADECGHHRFATQSHEGYGAFKVPGLRNVADTAPYMHDGRFEALQEVLEHYRDPPSKATSDHELPELELTDTEMSDLANFLLTLTGEASVEP